MVSLQPSRTPIASHAILESGSVHRAPSSLEEEVDTTEWPSRSRAGKVWQARRARSFLNAPPRL